MNYFDYISSFISKFKKTKVLVEEVSDEVYEYLAAQNKDYADFIRKEGFCSYENGLFSIVNPFTYKEEFNLPGITRLYSGEMIIKTGFGDFIVSDLKYDTNCLHHSFYNGEYNIGSKVGYLLTFQMTDTSFLNETLKKRLFVKATKQFGVLQTDENFGFPMDFPWDREAELEKIENVLVYKTKDYLKLLSEKYK